MKHTPKTDIWNQIDSDAEMGRKSAENREEKKLREGRERQQKDIDEHNIGPDEPSFSPRSR